MHSLNNETLTDLCDFSIQALQSQRKRVKESFTAVGVMSWNIKVRVIRVWVVSDFTRPNIPFSMELVLVDSQGDRIHASIRKTLIYKFKNDLREGSVYSIQYFGVAVNGGQYRTAHHKYKINFQFGTNVTLLAGGSVPEKLYEFVNLSTITGGGFDTDYLVDVIGLLTGVGTEREYDRNGTLTKMNVICVEADGDKIECTLFGSYVDELNTFLSSGEAANAVVIMQFAKVKCFQDKINLQNCFNSTKLIFNPHCEESVKLKQRMSQAIQSPSQCLSQLTDGSTARMPRVTMEEEFLQLTPRSTIEGLKDSKEEGCFIVFATVKHVIGDEDWWYNACICAKAVYPDCKMFFCEKCNKHVMKVVPRYRIKIRVIDETDSATFVIFDQQASLMFHKSCAEMFETHDKSKPSGSVPKDIADLVDKSYLFKVEVKEYKNARFEQSYIVKKICSDLSIIHKFGEGIPKSLDVNSVNLNLTNVKVSCIADSSTLIAQDLMKEFSGVVVDTESQSGEKESLDLSKVGEEKEALDLSKDGEELTPMKNDFVRLPTEVVDLDKNDENAMPIKMISSAIKQKEVVAIGEIPDEKDSSPPKRDFSIVGKKDEFDVPLIMLKKKIKLEKE